MNTMKEKKNLQKTDGMKRSHLLFALRFKKTLSLNMKAMVEKKYWIDWFICGF